MRKIARGRDQSRAGDVIRSLKIQQLGAPHRVQSFLRTGKRPAQRLVRPERLIEQLLDLVLRLVEVHGQLFLDDAPLLLDFNRIELRVEKHVAQYIEQFIETVTARFRVKAGAFFAGERIQIAADAFNGLGDFPGGAPFRAFEQQVFDEMRHAVQFGRFITPSHADPKPETYTCHVRHFQSGDGEAVGKPGDLMHGGNGDGRNQASVLGWVSGGLARRW